MEYRKCKKCKNNFPVEEFKVNSKLPHGLEKICKGCRAGIEYNDFGNAIDPIAMDYRREEIYFRDQGICYLCGDQVSVFEYEVDHVEDFPEEMVIEDDETVIGKKVTKSERLALERESKRKEELKEQAARRELEALLWDTQFNVAVVHAKCKKAKGKSPDSKQTLRFLNALRNPSLSKVKDWIEAKYT